MRRERLRQILKEYGIKIAYVFGSQREAGIAFLDGMAPDVEGDLDIGVVFEELPHNAFDLYGEIYAELSVIFEPFEVDLVFLQETGMLFQYEAIRGELVYCDDDLFLDDYEEMVLKMASDLSFKKADFEKDFLEAVKDGYFEIEHR